MAEGFSKLFGTSFDDPRTQGILGLAGGLLEAGGYQSQPMTLGQALSYGGRQGMQSYQTALEAQRAEADRKLREQQLKQSMEIQAAQEARQAQAVKAKRDADLRLQTGIENLIAPSTRTPMQRTPQQNQLISLAASSPELASLIGQQQIQKQFEVPKDIKAPTTRTVTKVDQNKKLYEVEVSTTPVYENGRIVGYKEEEVGARVPIQEKAPDIVTMTVTENGREVEKNLIYKPDDPKADLQGFVVYGSSEKQPEPFEFSFVKTTQDGESGTVEATRLPVGDPRLLELSQNPNFDVNAETGFVTRIGSFVADPVKQTQQFQNKGAYMKDGKFIGEGIFDKHTGTTFLEVEKNGKRERVPLPIGAIPRTESALARDIPSISQFQENEDKIFENQRSLKKYIKYLESLDKAAFGLERFATDVSTNFKTILIGIAENNDLTPQELATRIAEGRLQGLVGMSRLEVVGPGVMTEQDAVRVIKSLGGDFNLLQNPDVVKVAISELFGSKYTQYKRLIDRHNINVENFYGDKGYDPIVPFAFDTRLLDPDVVLSLKIGEVELPPLPNNLDLDAWEQLKNEPDSVKLQILNDPDLLSPYLK